MTDIALICEAISLGGSPGRKPRPPRAERSSVKRAPRGRVTPGVCSCGKTAPRGKTCGGIECVHAYRMEWQDRKRAADRAERERLHGPTIYGPKPKGTT